MNRRQFIKTSGLAVAGMATVGAFGSEAEEKSRNGDIEIYIKKSGAWKRVSVLEVAVLDDIKVVRCDGQEVFGVVVEKSASYHGWEPARLLVRIWSEKEKDFFNIMVGYSFDLHGSIFDHYRS